MLTVSQSSIENEVHTVGAAKEDKPYPKVSILKREILSFALRDNERKFVVGV